MSVKPFIGMDWLNSINIPAVRLLFTRVQASRGLGWLRSHFKASYSIYWYTNQTYLTCHNISEKKNLRKTSVNLYVLIFLYKNWFQSERNTHGEGDRDRETGQWYRGACFTGVFHSQGSQGWLANKMQTTRPSVDNWQQNKWNCLGRLDRCLFIGYIIVHG